MKTAALLLTLVLVADPSTAAAQGCLDGATGRNRQSMSHTADDGDVTIRIRHGDCEIRVDSRGEFTVAPDLRGVSSISDRGYLQLEERDGSRERSVRITSAAGGINYRWSLNGREGFDVDRNRWLSDMLLALERRTGMFARSRIPELMKQGGVNAVLDEAGRLESDHARRLYYSALLAGARLDDPQVERLLREAGASMRSDWERAELLKALAARGPMSDAVTRAFIGVTTRMSSDYERRRSLAAALESVRSPAARNALFIAASDMSSDYEVAELLIAAQRRNLVDSVTAAAYFRAVEGLSSDYEHRRTLSSLLKLKPQSDEVLSGVLRSATRIDSDYELASLLVEFAGTTSVRGRLRELYIQATRTLSSDWEYRRALAALVEQDSRS